MSILRSCSVAPGYLRLGAPYLAQFVIVGNLLRELDRTRYIYDDRGNLVYRVDWGGPTWVYRYDLSNRMVEANRYAKTPEVMAQRNGTDHLTQSKSRAAIHLTRSHLKVKTHT